jgi:hypothetical protein
MEAVSRGAGAVVAMGSVKENRLQIARPAEFG